MTDHSVRLERRMPPKGRFAGCSDGDGDSFLVLGLPCTLFPGDSESAQAIHNEQHLLGWSADSSALVDRFDVRLLLDRWREDEEDAMQYEDRMEAHMETMSDRERAIEAEAERERYRDLVMAEAEAAATATATVGETCDDEEGGLPRKGSEWSLFLCKGQIGLLLDL